MRVTYFRTVCLLAVAIPCLVAGCPLNTGDTGTPVVNDVSGPLSLADVRFWAYQIQKVDDNGAVEALASTHYDMLVLEPTRTDAELANFDTKGMVQRLKSTKASDGTHRKLIIAYVDIGEAEDWRWYWTWSKESDEAQASAEQPLPGDWPDYIVGRDPDGWVGNYPIAYWDAEWKDLIIHGQNQSTSADRDYTSMLDELILDGFDGIYLDWVEGFENANVIAAAAAAGVDPATKMIRFIGELRDYARQRDPDFLVIQQNAGALIAGHPELLNVIDAIAQEGIWFDGSASDDWGETTGYWETDQQLTGEYIGWLDQYLGGGVPVFACEYALEQNADEAYTRAAARGYVPYVTRRSLGRLTTTTPPGY